MKVPTRETHRPGGDQHPNPPQAHYQSLSGRAPENPNSVSQPFEYLIIDCVGPLPRSKSGCAYLFTVMCQTTRFPAAYPLRSITTKSVLKALTQFISLFGIPKVIQSDQGSNFTSHLFAQVLQQLRIQHNLASAYHAQSQGALERFHQTLKSLLRSYCTEMGRDWEEGLPWMLMAVRTARTIVCVRDK